MNAQTDKTASFMEAARPFVPDLLASAKHHIRYHQAIGDRIDELSPEELVGETLIRASHRGSPRPNDVPLRSWLLALETRTLDDLVARSTEDRKLWSFSLDQPIPPPTAVDFDDSFWDWYQPPEDSPSMAEEVADPTANPGEAQTALEDDTGWHAKLEPTTWRAWLLHEVHRLSFVDVASSLRLTGHKTRSKISEAWSVYRQSSAD